MSALVLIPLGGLAALYAVAARGTPGWPRRRIFYAAVGLLLLGAVAPLTEGTLALDMVGHGLIICAAVPLLVLSRPLGLLHRHLDPGMRARMRTAELPVGRALEPWLLWLAFVGLQWFFHLGPLAEQARGDGLWHSLEHGLFFFSALAFWSAVLVPAPGMRRMGDPERAGYLLAAMPAVDLIGVIWIGQGLTAAGVVMIVAMLPLGLAFFAVAWRSMLAQERTARRLEARSDASRDAARCAGEIKAPLRRAAGVGRV